MDSLVRAAVGALVASIAVAPVFAAAQSTVAPPVATTGPAPADTSTPAAAASAKPVSPATGYSYGGSTATARADRPRPRASRGDPADASAVMSGFETMDDGSTRLFVELSKPTSYDTKAGPSNVTYVLKGAHVDRRNNENPLVTTHFNTPVTSARLVSHGRDLWFVVDLRAHVQPTTAMSTTKEGATLRIGFAKGDYLSSNSTATPAASAPPEPQPPATPVPIGTPPAKSTPVAAQ
jgi:hypothetical protein